MEGIVTEIFRAGLGVTREKTGQNTVVNQMGKLSQKLAVTHIIAAFTLLTTLIRVAAGQDGFDKIAAAGAPIPGVKSVTYKSNQSQVVYYQNTWWGVFEKDVSGSPWHIYKFNGSSWSEGPAIGISGEGGADMHVDETNGKLYVLISKQAKVSRLSYSGGNWILDSGAGFPKSVSITPAPGNAADDPACITQAFNGNLFIFWVSGSVRGLYSSNQGIEWSEPFSIASISDDGLTDAIAFHYNDRNYIGLFVGKNNGSEFLFFRLEEDKDPANSGDWEQETLPITNDSDNHVDIVRDNDHNLYMIGKWGSSNKFRLYKRKNNGDSYNWSYYNISPSSGTRPALSIDESNNNLIIFGTVSSKIQFYVMDKNNLHDVSSSGWVMALENGSDVFNDVTVSYQIVDDVSNLMVCASNTSASSGKVWYNLLDVNDITLPVFLASFQATPDAGQINLEWVTQSEVDNWEFIVFRQDNEEGEFREITRLPGSGTTNVATYYNYIDYNVEPDVTYAYRLANVDFNGQVNYYPEIVRSSLSPVVTFKLYNNYPNPFNSETTISFEVGETAHTELMIYDASGQLVKRLFEGKLSPGSYVYKWNGRDDYEQDVASGMYFLSVTSGTFRQSLRMVLSR